MSEYQQPYLKDKFVVEWNDAMDIESPGFRFSGFHPGSTVLPRGWQKRPDTLPLPCAVRFDRDQAIPLRDGTLIYADIYRPDTEDKVPAILASTMFGKNGSYVTLDDIPGRNGVPAGALSELQTWEAPDPAWWVKESYAVVNIDVRGVGMSQGNGCYFGSQDSDDNYDVIEWLAEQPWCNGKVGMAGNSWLAITQWYAAAKHPPHLCAIAPWEGHGNMYEDEYMRGGVPNFSFSRTVMSYGRNRMEDLEAMMRKYPLWNDYWQDKAAPFEECTVPAYVVASYSSEIHTHGTFEGFRRISSPEKWLRVHNTQEWPDLYDEDNSRDLLRFFDHYLKDIDNGWENTPRVRLAVLDPEAVGEPAVTYERRPGPDPLRYTRAADGSVHPYPNPVINVPEKSAKAELQRPEEDFPLARQIPRKLYLNAEGMTLDPVQPAEEAESAYRSDDYLDHVTFTHVFERDTEITGYMKLHVWMETREAEDMDVYVRISKLNDKGQMVFHDCRMWSYSGPNGILRASHREIDPARSTEYEPFHPHTSLLPVEKGVPVALDIGLWPTGMKFHKGEAIQVNIAGFDYLGLTGAYGDCVTFNTGDHFVRTGGQYDSWLLYPEIPQA